MSGCLDGMEPKTVLLIVLHFVYITSAYKHVILMHGLLGSPLEFLPMRYYIEMAHPGTTVTAINAYDGEHSLRPMWEQTNKIRTMMADVMREHPEGTHLLCYSQGGLLCRAVLQTLPDHNVYNFISLSSPQAGQFGDTAVVNHFIPPGMKEEIYRFFYSSAGQKISVGNYWNDPHRQDLYCNKSVFLAVINNQSIHNHSLSYEFKQNFLRIKNLIMIGGENDSIITPWQSSHFAAYDNNETVREMKYQPWYTKDSFGLQTLDKRGGITMYSVPGYNHFEWPASRTIFQKYIEKWLD